MEYGAFAIAALGLVIGLLFRVKVLLPIVGLLLVASVVFSIASQTTFLDAALTILIAQAILQGSYFIGATVSVMVSNSGGNRRVL